jgi:hypothetical protein
MESYTINVNIFTVYFFEKSVEAGKTCDFPVHDHDQCVEVIECLHQ